MGHRLTRAAFARPVLTVAAELLGALLVADDPSGRVALRLTEVEAYDGEADPGSHAFRGRTARNATMYGPPGHAYVYFTYGMHYCVNVVCAATGTAAAVLLRAGEVVDGVDLARARRPGAADRDLARGPARLTRALGIDRRLDGADLLDPAGPLQLHPPAARVPAARVGRSPRTGVGGAGATAPWRFYLRDEPTVSAYRPHVPRRRPPRAPAHSGGG